MYTHKIRFCVKKSVEGYYVESIKRTFLEEMVLKSLWKELVCKQSLQRHGFFRKWNESRQSLRIVEVSKEFQCSAD